MNHETREFTLYKEIQSLIETMNAPMKKADFESEIKWYVVEYRKILAKCEELYSGLLKDRSNVYIALQEGEDHEKLMFISSDLKHSANGLLKVSISSQMSAEADLRYLEAQVRFGYADRALQNRGFVKVTEALRETAVNSMSELRDLRKTIGSMKAMSKSSEKLVEHLLADEVNFRKTTIINGSFNGSL